MSSLKVSQSAEDRLNPLNVPVIGCRALKALLESANSLLWKFKVHFGVSELMGYQNSLKSTLSS